MGDYPSMSSKWEIHNYQMFLLKWVPCSFPFSLKHIPEWSNCFPSKRTVLVELQVADIFAKTALWLLLNLYRSDRHERVRHQPPRPDTAELMGSTAFQDIAVGIKLNRQVISSLSPFNVTLETTWTKGWPLWGDGVRAGRLDGTDLQGFYMIRDPTHLLIALGHCRWVQVVGRR